MGSWRQGRWGESKGKCLVSPSLLAPGQSEHCRQLGDGSPDPPGEAEQGKDGLVLRAVIRALGDTGSSLCFATCVLCDLGQVP